MAGRGLLQRRPDPTNRTRTLVSLTDEGWALFSAAVRESNVDESDILRGLDGTERQELARLLEIVIDGLDDVDASPARGVASPT
jgi:DNA-binding MarR family transcriptional regulator